MPLGTENLLARQFGHTAEAESVMRTIRHGTSFRLDAGTANNRPFLIMATCGFDAEVVRGMHLTRRGHIQRLSYLRPILGALRKYRFPKLRVRVDDDEPFECCWGMVFNLPRYGGFLNIEPDAVGNDGLLDVIAFEQGSITSGLKYVAGIWLGRHFGFRDVIRRRGKQDRNQLGPAGSFPAGRGLRGTAAADDRRRPRKRSPVAAAGVSVPQNRRIAAVGSIAKNSQMADSTNPNGVRVTPVTVGPYRCGDDEPLLLIAGPCVLQSLDLSLQIAETLAGLNDRRSVNVVFKGSFDKANRTSLKAERGPGMEDGLRILEEVEKRTGLPTTTDVHLPDQAASVAEVCSLLQIPAFLSRQTDLLVAVASTGRPVNVKKGQFMSPEDMRYVVEKLRGSGDGGVMLCERGTFFGYGRLVNDMQSLPHDEVPRCSGRI